MEAKLDRSGLFKWNKRQRQYVTVNSLVDLNKISAADKPITISHDYDFYNNCCFVDAGSVSATLTLPKACFTPGEPIPITAEIQNHSRKKIQTTRAALCMAVTYRESGGKTIKTDNVILVREI